MTGQGNPSNRWLYWIAGITAFRIIYLAIFPVGLAGDEAYYWEWGRQPDWGYFSKPPYIGWQMAVLHWLGWDTTFGIRLPSVLYASGLLVAVYWLGRSLFRPEAGFTAMLLVALTPGNVVQGLIATIDSPLLFFWASALLTSWNLFYGKGGLRWAVLLILCLGLGNLTKQMMLVFPLLLLVVLAMDPMKRKGLADWRLWAGWAVTLLFLLPPLYWNSQHEWITFQHTGEHFNRGDASALKQVGRFFEFVLAEAFILNPVLYFAGLGALWGATRKFGDNAQNRFLWVFSAPAILVFFFLATRQRVNPNWPAVFYLPMALLLSGQIDALAEHKLRKAAIAVGFCLAFLTYAFAFLIPMAHLEGTKMDIFKKFRGYDECGRQLGEFLQTVPERDNMDIVVIGHRYQLCQFAFNTPGQPRTLAWNDPEAPVTSQYGIWEGLPHVPARPAIVVIQAGAPFPKDWGTRYKTLAKLPRTIEIGYNGKLFRRYELYQGTPFPQDTPG